MPPALRLPPRSSPGLGDASSAINEINSALQQAGLPPDQVQSAITAYTGLDAASTSCILGILDGGPVTLTSLAPLIGAGLLATGVGAPIAAAVTALLPVLDGIIGMFSPPQEHCTWKVGYYCFNRVQPYGPTDPLWETWGQFQGGRPDDIAIHNWATWNGSVLGTTANCPACWIPVYQPFGSHPSSVLNRYGQVVHTDALGALPGFMEVMACELNTLDAPGAVLTPEQSFRRAYYHAWQAANEFAINGYKSPDYYALLKACADAWNRAHAPTATYTFQPISGPIPSVDQATSTFTCDPKKTYIGLLLSGVVNSSADQTTPRDHPPVTINIGPRIVKLNIGAIRKSTTNVATATAAAAPLSTPAKVAIGAGVVAGGAAVGVGIWAWATKQAYGEAWGQVWSRTKRVVAKPFKRR